MNLVERIELLISELDEENKKYPCRENSLIKTKLQEARMWAEEKSRVQNPQPAKAEILTEPAPLVEPKVGSETVETGSEKGPVPETLNG